MLRSRRLDLQRLDIIFGQPGKNGEKSRSGKRKLFCRLLFEKLVDVQHAEAVVAEQGMQMVKKLRNQQTYRVIHGSRALPRSLFYLLLCHYRACLLTW